MHVRYEQSISRLMELEYEGNGEANILNSTDASHAQSFDPRTYGQEIKHSLLDSEYHKNVRNNRNPLQRTYGIAKNDQD